MLTLDFGSATLDSAKYMNQREFFNSADDKGKVLGFLRLTNTMEHLTANILIGNLNLLRSPFRNLRVHMMESVPRIGMTFAPRGAKSW